MEQLDDHWRIASADLPWRPLSLPRPRTPWLHPRARIPLLALIAMVHLLGAVWLLADRAVESDLEDAAPSTWVEFVTLPAPLEIPETIVIRPPPAAASRASAPAPVIRPTSSVTVEQAPALLAQEDARAPENPLRLFTADGAPLLPEDMLDQLDRKFGDQRDFSFQRPGLDGMDKLLSRPQALTYEATRFEAGWRPETDLLTDLLEKAVEKTSPEIRIPVPGRPGARLVCRVVLLAAGGGCWFESNSDGYQVVLNDPDTLNEEEQRQCQAWWDKIVGAGSQAVWRKTRDLYEAECRKPAEKKAVEPSLQSGGSG